MKKKNLGMILAIMFMVSSFPAFTVLGNTETVTVGPLTGSISVGSNETKTLAGTFVYANYGGSQQVNITGANSRIILDNLNLDFRGTTTLNLTHNYSFIDASAATGKLTIELRGNNYIYAAQNHAVVRAGGHEIEFTGSGSLTAAGGGTAPAIGGNGMNVNFNMNGGKVTATGGATAAGIGTGTSTDFSDFSYITVNNGTIESAGGAGNNDYTGGAGIGMGALTNSSSKTGTITINGGAVKATGGEGGGAGIGGGFGNESVNDRNLTGKVNLNNGTVEAYGTGGGAGIGGSRGHAYTQGYTEGGSGWNISISGGTVSAAGSNTDSQGSAGIGGGCGTGNSWPGETGNINISGGTVTATGGGVGNIGGAGIGSGGYTDVSQKGRPCNSNITISGNANITATGGGAAVGIGGGSSRMNGPIQIYGGTVRAYGGENGGSAMGGTRYGSTCLTPRQLNGSLANHSVNIDIYGGTVYANATGNSNALTSDINIRGGVLRATGSGSGGGGNAETAGRIAMYGGEFYATGGASADYVLYGFFTQFGGKSVIWNNNGAATDGIGVYGGESYLTSADGSFGSVTMGKGENNGMSIVYAYKTGLYQGLTSNAGIMLTAANRPADPSNPTYQDYANASIKIIGLTKETNLPQGIVLNIPAGQTFEIPLGITLINNGTINNNGTIINRGRFVNNNLLNNNQNATIQNFSGFENNSSINNYGRFINEIGSSYSGNSVSQNGEFYITAAKHGIRITRKGKNLLFSFAQGI